MVSTSTATESHVGCDNHPTSLSSPADDTTSMINFQDGSLNHRVELSWSSCRCHLRRLLHFDGIHQQVTDEQLWFYVPVFTHVFPNAFHYFHCGAAAINKCYKPVKFHPAQRA